MKGKPVRTFPVETGYSYHSESNFDIMQPVLTALCEHFEAIDLPLRSIENEWGPGQVECTFAPKDALTTADNLILFRSATRQITRRMGYLASFMARPAIAGFCASGWHLHQSMTDASGKKNLFMPAARSGDPLTPLGMHYLAGLLRMRRRRRRSPRRPSTAIAATSRIRSRPTAPPGPMTIAA